MFVQCKRVLIRFWAFPGLECSALQGILNSLRARVAQLSSQRDSLMSEPVAECIDPFSSEELTSSVSTLESELRRINATIDSMRLTCPKRYSERSM